MSVLNAVLIGLATGIVFGFALEKSRVFEPGVIIGQMQLRNFLMLKVFFAAVIAGLVVLAVMNGLFGVKLSLKPLLYKADIIGGLILGAGITLAGACPRSPTATSMPRSPRSLPKRATRLASIRFWGCRFGQPRSDLRCYWRQCCGALRGCSPGAKKPEPTTMA
jgi:hypothetical protein